MIVTVLWVFPTMQSSVLAITMYHHGELTHHDETKKRAHDSQITCLILLIINAVSLLSVPQLKILNIVSTILMHY